MEDQQHEKKIAQLGIDLEEAKKDLISKQTELEQEQRKTADAQSKAAEAQIELTRSFGRLVKRSGNRVLHIKEFKDSLAGKPEKTVEIWYKPEDDEARAFSGDIYLALQDVKWPVSVRTYKAEEKLSGISVGSVTGMMVASRDPADVVGPDNFLIALLQAMLFGGGGLGVEAPELPPNTIVVVIGSAMRQ